MIMSLLALRTIVAPKRGGAHVIDESERGQGNICHGLVQDDHRG